jgi:MerR family transcriptional regulator, mercuric resistance operon regulatory protein
MLRAAHVPAAAAGVNVETVRYYQRIGLMGLPRRAPGGIRRYGQDHLMRLVFVKSAQGLGFALSEVADLVKLDDGTQCHEAHTIATRKLADVQRRIQQLQQIEKVLAKLVRQCAARRGAVRCPMIAALKGSPD